MINSIQAAGITTPVAIKISSAASVITEEPACAKSTDTLPASPKLSSLSRQLSESAERARVRDNTLSRQQLGDLGREIELKLMNGCVPEIQARRALELPDTEDPERLERALQAARFVANNYEADSRVTNPFAGLSREQLTLIVYDNSGAYTVNERDAAWKSVKQIEIPWRKKVVTEGELERNQTGGAPNFLRECLAHYRALPKIEQAMHPADYEATTLRWIEEDLEAQRTGKKDLSMLTLVELLARMNSKLPGQAVAGGESPSSTAKASEAKAPDEITTNN
jgi:hypothetical protein